MDCVPHYAELNWQCTCCNLCHCVLARSLYLYFFLSLFLSFSLSFLPSKALICALGMTCVALFPASYGNICFIAGRTVLEVIQDFSSAKLPLNWFVEACPKLQPRQFSIASSQAAFPNEAHICLALVRYRTPYKRLKEGLCSKWLAGLKPGEIKIFQNHYNTQNQSTKIF